MDTDLLIRPRAAGLLVSVAALVLVGSGLTSESLAQSPSATPTTSASVIHDWPGARANLNVPGLYSWTVGLASWMHNVPCAKGSVWGGKPCTSDPELGPVEITFDVLPEDADSIPIDDIGRLDTDLDGSFSEVPQRVGDTRKQAWVLAVDGTNVVVIITSYPDTTAELVAEAEAIVRSIYVEPAGTGPGQRVVFTRPANWDSG